MPQLTLVVFQGYAVFTRHNPVWSFVAEDWGFGVAPWVMIGVVLVLYIGWQIHDYRQRGEMSLLTPLMRVDLLNGIAPVEDEDKPTDWFKRSCLWILNKI